MIKAVMTFSQAVILLAAGALGGIASTVASIASVVSYPVLPARPPGSRYQIDENFPLIRMIQFSRVTLSRFE
jgi:hypothetical protein